MMRTSRVILIIGLCCLFLFGCSVTAADKPNESTLDAVILEKIKKEISTAKNIDNFKIVNSVSTQGGNLVQVQFSADDQDYIGLFHILDKEIINSDINGRDKTAPFDILVMMSSLKDNSELVPYVFVGGFINDNEIRELLITYEDESLVAIPLNENQSYYSYARIGNYATVKEIVANNVNGKILYKYPPYPPAPQ